jgi:acyl-CoA reductase-like NAD-dependent aldehyde dehydrogenase
MPNPKRVAVWKTYKLFIGGQFPRTESGRSYAVINARGKTLANACLSSRKDLREAVVAARTAFGSWSQRSAFNRGQILYRMAELLESRKVAFKEELMLQGKSATAAAQEIKMSIDRLIYYAGWCDKYAALFSAVNPVATSHYNFSVPEPTGVVALIAPATQPLLGIISLMAPCIAGGNTCVILADEKTPLSAISFAEVLHSSDLPGGVVNVLTGKQEELLAWVSNHMDINAIVAADLKAATWQLLQKNGAVNVKRVFHWKAATFLTAKGQSPYLLLDLQEIKTTWHPIQNIAGSGISY